MLRKCPDSLVSKYLIVCFYFFSLSIWGVDSPSEGMNPSLDHSLIRRRSAVPQGQAPQSQNGSVEVFLGNERSPESHPTTSLGSSLWVFCLDCMKNAFSEEDDDIEEDDDEEEDRTRLAAAIV